MVARLGVIQSPTRLHWCLTPRLCAVTRCVTSRCQTPVRTAASILVATGQPDGGITLRTDARKGSARCHARARSHVPGRFSVCPTTGDGAVSRRAFGSAGGIRTSRAWSRRGPSVGATRSTSRGCFGAAGDEAARAKDAYATTLSAAAGAEPTRRSSSPAPVLPRCLATRPPNLDQRRPR